MNTSRHSEPGPGEIGADALEATAVGVRAVEVALLVFGWLLVTPPLLVMAFVVVVPTVTVMAVVLALVAVVAVPTMLVRRVLAHHREHGSTVFLHRLRARASAVRLEGADLGNG